MFTGIITDIGHVRAVEKAGDTRFTLATAYPAEGIEIGASIACSGACLTVVAKGRDEAGDWFAVTASAETLDKTKLGAWTEGSRVNLERALKVGDELGGHIVTGHVDGLGTVESVKPEGDSWRLRFKVPKTIAPYVASKGSIAVDGVSLTVNEVEDTPGGTVFGVNVIPHTHAHTTLGDLREGERVNLEIDVLARYVARLGAVIGR